MKVLYVSPHPDDVAFSAAARLAGDGAAGHELAVVTLFAPDAAAPPAVGDAVARGAEDRAFAQRTGALLLDGGFRDAIVRRPRYRALRHLFGPLAADEEPLVEAVRRKLQSLVEAGYRKVVAPLGIGRHVDHQLAHAAARRLRGAEVLFYEDTPYVFTPYQLGRRLDELGLAVEPDATTGRASTVEELRASARTWLDAPLLRSLAPPPRHWLALASILVESQLMHRPRRGKAGGAGAVADVIAGEQQLASVACYPSQWKLFFPSLEAWGAALAGYAQRMGRSGLVERAWRIEDQV